MNEAKDFLRELLHDTAASFPYISLVDIRAALSSRKILVKPATVNHYLHEMMKSGLVFNAGRGWYSRLSAPFALDRKPIRRFVKALEKRFPLLDFSCWSTAQIAAYSHHQLARFVSFVYVERDAMESVAEALREKGLTAFINPSQAEVGKNVRLAEGVVIVRPAITRAPVDEHYATIEKILVDLYMEAGALRLMDEAECRQISLNAVSSGRISISALRIYAEDRRRLPSEKIFGIEIN